MHVTTTGLDTIGALLGLIILVVSLLTLLGMGALMAIGAVFSHRPLVTSWPADQEQSFTPYERRGSAANAQAWTFSLIGAGLVTVLAAGVYLGVAPDERDMGKDMNMSNLTKKRPPPPAKPVAAPAEAPRPEAPAPAEAPAQ
jgi:hypothetical protein